MRPVPAVHALLLNYCMIVHPRQVRESHAVCADGWLGLAWLLLRRRPKGLLFRTCMGTCGLVCSAPKGRRPQPAAFWYQVWGAGLRRLRGSSHARAPASPHRPPSPWLAAVLVPVFVTGGVTPRDLQLGIFLVALSLRVALEWLGVSAGMQERASPQPIFLLAQHSVTPYRSPWLLYYGF